MKPLLCLLLILPLSAFAQKKQKASTPAPAAPAAEQGSDKMDLQKLEDKYWAAKETDMAVVQNRTYTKAKRAFVNLGYGTLLNDAYSTGRMPSITAGYFFSERWGLELAHEMGSLSDNGSTTFMQQFNGLKPNYNKFQTYTSANFVFVPFYSKASFMDRAITYFDIQVAVGIGQMKYESQIDPAQGDNRAASSIGYNLDITQQLFFNRWVAFRLDLKNKWTRQDLFRYRINGTETEDARPLGSQNQQDTTLMFGVTIFLQPQQEQ